MMNKYTALKVSYCGFKSFINKVNGRIEDKFFREVLKASPYVVLENKPNKHSKPTIETLEKCAKYVQS